jgi:hypothetical protein
MLLVPPFVVGKQVRNAAREGQPPELRDEASALSMII